MCGLTICARTRIRIKECADGSLEVAPIGELTDFAVEAGVKLFPCAMTMKVFGYEADDFIEGSQDICGAAAFLSYASDADITLAF